ncbi:MAG: thioredoxin [Candidatus Cloacimonetes bacterium]|jgi:thioredoxin 1|nr:thioredoxin [Candidatus Cloacimonadota bacterium]NLO43878.1 thioredoxin [Candidatus Cloacimonadota bacterium]
MAIIEVNSASFESEVLQCDKPVLIDFWAPWCGPCKALNPVIQKLTEEVGDNVKICKINIDESPDIAGKYSIMSIPTLLIMKGGEPVDQLVGLVQKNKIMDKLNPHIS